MDGAHDMGGVPGFGPVQPEPNEPPFHAEWERRVFAITLAMGMPGGWNIDMSRFARENRPPADYLSKSYFEIWLARTRTADGRARPRRAGRSRRRPCAACRPSRWHGCSPPRALLRCCTAAARLNVTPAGPPASAVGDRVRARMMSPPTHTRLPRYVRGHVGTIAARAWLSRVS